jgi:tetratricopeptide (TPR) repeat protein
VSSNRPTLKTWLSENEYTQIEAEWQEQRELGSKLKDKPTELKRYEEKLKHAKLHCNRAESYSIKGKHNTAKKFYNKSESLCEDALEILHHDSSVHIWFDRDVSFEVGGDLSAGIVSLTRFVISRSNEKLKDYSRHTARLKRHTKRD